MLIIGYGNPDRGDDAAGILVARRLHELGRNATAHSGDGYTLLDLWNGEDEVVVIDATVADGSPGSVGIWDVEELQIAEPGWQSSTHEFGLGQAIRLARVLGLLPPRLTIYGIEGGSFEPGAPPSRAVLLAVEQVAQEIMRAAHSGVPVRTEVTQPSRATGDPVLD